MIVIFLHSNFPVFIPVVSKCPKLASTTFIILNVHLTPQSLSLWSGILLSRIAPRSISCVTMCLFHTKTHCEKTEQTWAIIKIQQVFTTGNCIREAFKMIENNLYTLYRNCSTMIIDKGIFFCKKRRLGYHTSYKTRWPFGRMAPNLSKKMRKKT